MSASKMDVSGFADLDRKFAQLTQVSTRKEVRDVLRAGAVIIADEERTLVPVRSGRTKRSITVRTQPGFAVDREVVGDIAVYVGPRRGSGGRPDLVEWGTEHSAPEPFVRPAVDAKGGEAIKIVLTGLDSLLSKATR